MHDKFFVVNHRWLWTGSTNMSENDILRNNNGSLKIDEPTLAALYEQELAQMHDGLLFGRKKAQLDPSTTFMVSDHEISVHFSPGDPHQAILDALETADQRVYFMIFSFTRQDIADKLIALHQQGVEVVGIFDESQALGRYSVDDGQCHWVKQYIGRHNLFYKGYNEGKGIWGTWELVVPGASATGGFHIWPEGEADPTRPHLEEAVDQPVEDLVATPA